MLAIPLGFTPQVPRSQRTAGFIQPRRGSQSDCRGLILGEIPFFDRYGTEPSKPVKLACPWQKYENGAGVCRQTQAMKKKHSGSKDDSGFIHPPAYPIAGNKLFERIGADRWRLARLFPQQHRVCPAHGTLGEHCQPLVWRLSSTAPRLVLLFARTTRSTRSPPCPRRTVPGSAAP